MEIKFTVPGKPQGKGRPRFTRQGHAYTPPSTREYERTVAAAWQAAGAVRFPDDTPIYCAIYAAFPIPKSYSKKKRAAMSGALHMNKPDSDNVVKAVLDALNGCAFADDSAVSCVYAEKFWTTGDGEVVVTMRSAT